MRRRIAVPVLPIARAALVVGSLGLLALLVPPAPAAAHGGKAVLVVAGDGGTGVTIRATYGDGHPLDRTIRLVLNATGDGGRRIGPVQLGPSGEGEGFYASGPVLAPGRWRVTIAAPAPAAAEVATVIDARAAQSAPPVARRATAPPASGAARRMLWIAGTALAVALVAGALLAFRRRP